MEVGNCNEVSDLPMRNWNPSRTPRLTASSTVSDLPMRNWNHLQPRRRNEPSITFRIYLWGIETAIRYETVVPSSFRFGFTYEELKLARCIANVNWAMVSDLPMRNWNPRHCRRVSPNGATVSDLPMRNWNTERSVTPNVQTEFRIYLWGIETSPG